MLASLMPPNECLQIPVLYITTISFSCPLVFGMVEVVCCRFFGFPLHILLSVMNGYLWPAFYLKRQKLQAGQAIQVHVKVCWNYISLWCHRIKKHTQPTLKSWQRQGGHERLWINSTIYHKKTFAVLNRSFETLDPPGKVQILREETKPTCLIFTFQFIFYCSLIYLSSAHEWVLTKWIVTLNMQTSFLCVECPMSSVWQTGSCPWLPSLLLILAIPK